MFHEKVNPKSYTLFCNLVEYVWYVEKSFRNWNKRTTLPHCVEYPSNLSYTQFVDDWCWSFAPPSRHFSGCRGCVHTASGNNSVLGLLSAAYLSYECSAILRSTTNACRGLLLSGHDAVLLALMSGNIIDSISVAIFRHIFTWLDKNIIPET